MTRAQRFSFALILMAGSALPLASFAQGVPTGQAFDAKGITATKVALSWTAGLGKDIKDAIAYLVFRDGVNIATLPAAAGAVTFDYTDSGLSPTSVHQYIVALKEGNGTVASGTPSLAITKKAWSPISVGSAVTATDKVRVRSFPSVTAPVIGSQNAGAAGKVVDGPEYFDTHTWWKVTYDTGASGWSAQKFLEKIQ